MKGAAIIGLFLIPFLFAGVSRGGLSPETPPSAQVESDTRALPQPAQKSERSSSPDEPFFDSGTLTLHVPCVSVLSEYYRAELSFSADIPNRLTVTQVIKREGGPPPEGCALFDFSENLLQISRINSDASFAYWAELSLVGSNPLAFAIRRAGVLGSDGTLECGVLGDSIGAATHANDACDPSLGDHRELMDCLQLRLGSHDGAWSFMGGSQSWSIASRLGCADVHNKSKDGEEWKDALDQATENVEEGQPENVIINLGSNDVCAKYGHDYGNLSFVQPTTPGHIVSIEAEHFIERFPGGTHQWEPDDTPGASILALKAQPDIGIRIAPPDDLEFGPRLDYSVHFVRAGTHYVWIRGYADSSGDRLIHVGLDGQPQMLTQDIGISEGNQWVWSGLAEGGTRAVIDVPSAGKHTLNLYMADDGFRLDKMALTTWSEWAPSGDGPHETARGVFKQENQSGQEVVAIEAEHYHDQEKHGVQTWEPSYQPGYSGGAAMKAVPNMGISYGPGAGPRMDYNVNFNAPGTYFVWIRGFAANGADDSIQVGVDGAVASTSGMIKLPDYHTWAWSNGMGDGAPVASIDLSTPGIHTVNLWMIEDGFIVDKIVLAKSAAYEPLGTGPEETWENDLGRIGGHIDDTMMYLTEHLSPYGQIYWSGIVDVVAFRDMMVDLTHDHAFRTCQDLWDLDIRAGTLQGDAKNSLCKGEVGDLCDWLPNQVQDEFLNRYLDAFRNDFKDDMPCGRVLDSRNTQEERDEARRFNKSLNDLLEQKAVQYHNRKAVKIHFTQKPWYSTDEFKPYFVSRMDCYHPNRLGQMKLAQMVWEGHNPDFTPTDSFYHEGFDSEDWCTQAFTTWDSCWYDGGWGECGDEFICENDASGWFKLGKETSNNEGHWIARDAGDLSVKSEVWAYFKHKRDQFDGDRLDAVGFYVWDGSAWDQVDRFERHNDAGNHCSQYYDLSAYKNAVPFKIKFEVNNSSDMKNGDKLLLDEISIFGW